jgi:plasmid stability protein
MARLVQVRDVPDNVHRTLKARAAQSGISLSEYLRAELALIAARPTPDEVRARLRERSPLTVPARERPAALIRRLRDNGR